MKNITVWIIIILMSIALIGLTSFQVYWINNAIRLNKEAFTETALSAMRQVVSSLEHQEVAQVASSSIMAFYADDQSTDKNFRYRYREEGTLPNGERYILEDHDSVPIQNTHHYRAIDRLPSLPGTPPITRKVVEDSSSITMLAGQI